VLVFRNDYSIAFCGGRGGSDEYHGGVAGLDLLVTARNFGVVLATLALAIDDDDGEVGVEEGEGAVLEGAGGVALGVDVADLFDFEGALVGDVLVAPLSEYEHASRVL